MTFKSLAVAIERAPTAGAGWVVLTNEGPGDLRVWQIGNTWGDEALSFEVSDGGSAVHVEREPQVYTRNLPESIELKPGARYRMPFDLLDGTWKLDAISRARGAGPSQPIEVAAVYKRAAVARGSRSPGVDGAHLERASHDSARDARQVRRSAAFGRT